MVEINHKGDPRTVRLKRLFFALWPDAALRDRISDWQQRSLSHGSLEPSLRLHLTLAFLGNVNEQQHQQVINLSNTIVAPAMSFSLNRIGYFERPQIVWLGPDRPPQKLLQLHEQIGLIAKACGLPCHENTYTPHVTLARQAPALAAPLHCPPMQWHVREYCLVESQTDAGNTRYQILRRFSLTTDELS